MTASFSLKICGTGSALGEKIVTNSALEKTLNTTDAWIKEKIGIAARRHVASGTATSDLAARAALQALARAGWRPDDLDFIIAATATPDHQSPGIGVRVQEKILAKTIPAWDIHNTSPGFLFACEAARGLLQLPAYRRGLVIGAEAHSPALDFSERGRMMAVIFGDGAGAIAVEKTTDPAVGILGIKLHSEGKFFDKLWCEAPGTAHQPWISEKLLAEGRAAPTMDGRFVFGRAVANMSEVAQELLQELGLEISAIDFIIPHQANLRIIEAVAKNLQVPMEKFLVNIERTGNTSSAAIPIAWDEFARTGKIKPGMRLLMTSFGSGLSWGAMVVRV